MRKQDKQEKIYDVVQILFGDREHFKPRIIATCKSYQLAKGVIARCNTGMHTFEIIEREKKQ